MTKRIQIAIVAASLLFSGTAYAFNDIIVLAPSVTEMPDRGNGTDYPFPYDDGTINQSPIQGKGRISVVHNEPAPGEPVDEVAKAIQVLKDNGWHFGRRK